MLPLVGRSVAIHVCDIVFVMLLKGCAMQLRAANVLSVWLPCGCSCAVGYPMCSVCRLRTGHRRGATTLSCQWLITAALAVAYLASMCGCEFPPLCTGKSQSAAQTLVAHCRKPLVCARRCCCVCWQVAVLGCECIMCLLGSC